MSFKLFFLKLKRRILYGSGCLPSVAELRSRGVIVGENCDIYGSIDDSHGFLVTLGNNVTMASGSRILTHDGSTFKIVGYSRVGRVDIGDDVFIGACSIVLPNVKIGSNVIIGAGAVVTKDIPNNSVAVGNPARVIGSYDDYVEKVKKQFEVLPKWDTVYLKKTYKEKQQMKAELLESGYGFDK